MRPTTTAAGIQSRGAVLCCSRRIWPVHDGSCWPLASASPRTERQALLCPLPCLLTIELLTNSTYRGSNKCHSGVQCRKLSETRGKRAKQRSTVLYNDPFDPHMSLDEQYKNHNSKPELKAERNPKIKTKQTGDPSTQRIFY